MEELEALLYNLHSREQHVLSTQLFMKLAEKVLTKNNFRFGKDFFSTKYFQS